MNRMFDEHSFTDEITSNDDAKACVSYLAHNETRFRNELAEKGLDYDQIHAEVKKVWTNLLTACKKYGYNDYITDAKKVQFGIK